MHLLDIIITSILTICSLVLASYNDMIITDLPALIENIWFSYIAFGVGIGTSFVAVLIAIALLIKNNSIPEGKEKIFFRRNWLGFFNGILSFIFLGVVFS